MVSTPCLAPNPGSAHLLNVVEKLTGGPAFCPFGNIGWNVKTTLSNLSVITLSGGCVSPVMRTDSIRTFVI